MSLETLDNITLMPLYSAYTMQKLAFCLSAVLGIDIFICGKAVCFFLLVQ